MDKEKNKNKDKQNIINDNDLFTLSYEKEKILLTGDIEEDKKKIETINSSDINNRLNIMDKKDYSLISFITSTKRPDIYHRYCFTSGEDYQIKIPLKKQEEKNKNEEKEIKEEKENELNNLNDLNEQNELNELNDSSENESSSSLNYKSMKSQSMRYFTFNNNITYKCFNCGEVGHINVNCPYENIIYCLKCNRKGHEDINCPYTKCFKCNKFGHKNYQCHNKINKEKICNRCLSIGHSSNQCLKEPFYPYNEFYIDNNYLCQFCGSNKHLVCPFKKNFKFDFNFNFENNDNKDFTFSNDDIEKWEEFRKKYNKDDKKEENNFISCNNIKEESEEGEISIDSNNIINGIENSEIANCIFCPICSGRHSMEKCEDYILNKDKYKNKFDEQRKNYVIEILKNNKNNKDYKNNNKDYYKDYNNRNKDSNKDYKNNDKDYYKDYNNRNKDYDNYKKYERERSREKDLNLNYRNKNYENNKERTNYKHNKFNYNKKEKTIYNNTKFSKYEN